MNNKKSFLEIVLMPLAIALIGVSGSVGIWYGQREQARILAESEQKIEMVNIFSKNFASEDVREREIAFRILSVLSADFGVKLEEELDPNKEDFQKKLVEQSLTGWWKYTLLTDNDEKMEINGLPLEGDMALIMKGDSVDGWANWFDDSNSKFTGKYSNNTLIIARDTGVPTITCPSNPNQKGTIQQSFLLIGKGNKLTGIGWNQGDCQAYVTRVIMTRITEFQ